MLVEPRLWEAPVSDHTDPGLLAVCARAPWQSRGACVHLSVTWVEVTSYKDARVIGELLRERGAVGANLEALDDEYARRIVDFMAGLIFQARGQIERLTSRRFLISTGE